MGGEEATAFKFGYIKKRTFNFVGDGKGSGVGGHGVDGEVLGKGVDDFRRVEDVL